MRPDAGVLVREERLRRGVTQRILARQARVAQSVISRIETGAQHPTTEQLDSILAALGRELVLRTRPRSRRW